MAGSLELVALLQTQRDLYDLPPGRDRFERYLAVMTGGGPDIELPLALFNPMAKPHAAAALDRLIELGAESAADEAVVATRRRLPACDTDLRIALVLVDDLGGGWTNRPLTELGARLDSGPELRRGWVSVPLWTSQALGIDGVRRAVLEAIYRARFVLRWGSARSLGDVMLQEGMARAFAGGENRLDAAAIEQLCARIDPHRSSRHVPTIFACLYGDEAAAEVGYSGFDIPADGGWSLALAEALAQDSTPESLLVRSAG